MDSRVTGRVDPMGVRYRKRVKRVSKEGTCLKRKGRRSGATEWRRAERDRP